jgi:hypothetical protein
MDPATVVIITTLVVGVVTIIVERTFSHVKKSTCCGSEIEMKENIQEKK